jgi:uncharacterized protein (DUF302 family)
VARFTNLSSANGACGFFAAIDHDNEARQAGLELRETVLVLFGNPKAGTPIMVASPLAALDLPLTVVVWADGQQTKAADPATNSQASEDTYKQTLEGP